MALKKKSNYSANSGPRINRRIRARELRVIGPGGDQLGVLSLDDALQVAQDAGLDLVEVSPTAKPPVCKIIDYGKHKYLEKKKQQEARKKQTVTTIKEIKLRPRTDQHDREFKMRNLRRFLEEGNKAKVTMNFRGREVVYANRGTEMMKEIADQLEDVGKIDKEPSRQGRSVIMVLSPVAKGQK